MNYNMFVLPITIVFAFIVWIILSIKSSIKRKDFPSNLRSDDLFIKTVKHRNTWFTISMLWLIIEYLGLIIPFLSSCLALLANIFYDNVKVLTVIYSFVSMAIVVLVFAINPRKHSKGYRAAYVEADKAINQYLKEIDKQDILIQAMDNGENYIGDSFDL